MFWKIDPLVRHKWLLAKNILKENNINYIAVVISTKRPKWLNSLFPLASPNSPHLTGNALDLFIIPTSKIKDIIVALEKVEEKNPELSGGIGAYNRKSWWNGMVHIDTTRKGVRWGYDNNPDFPTDYYN